MRILVVADVHSNIGALEAILADAGAVDALWCLGDIVGYGPDPAAVIARLRGQPLAAVAGNHDLVAARKMGAEDFNPVAAEAVEWTARIIGEEEREFLASLPLARVEGEATLVHGSLRDPAWEYLLSAEQADEHLALQTTPLGFIGHSHIPFFIREEGGEASAPVRAADGTSLTLDERRVICNPGGAGQPRDGDPRASYILYDDRTRTVTWRRVEYDVAATQEKIRRAGLPSFLAERLAVGR